MPGSRDASCLVCTGKMESVDYLFVMCEVIYAVLYRIFRWVTWPRPLQPSILGVFELF